ncbi:MAG: hypothetical protein DRN07_03980 [Thermoplasmata archaeon]|nr:MAG: hypothetical protein DRN07_03980 [Thermoplasmata archaeon]
MIIYLYISCSGIWYWNKNITFIRKNRGHKTTVGCIHANTNKKYFCHINSATSLALIIFSLLLSFVGIFSMNPFSSSRSR